MLTIETPYGLVNWPNYDKIYVKNCHKYSTYECELVAYKHVGDNEDFGWSELTLCGGSEAHCNDMLGFVTDALRSNANVVTVRNGEPKSDHEPEESGHFEDLAGPSEYPEFQKPLGDGDRDGFEPHQEHLESPF